MNPQYERGCNVFLLSLVRMDKFRKKVMNSLTVCKTDWDILDLCIKDATEHMKLLPNVVDVEVQRGHNVVFVGDVHGDAKMLSAVLSSFGDDPTYANNWVFLGDYVDRGEQGLEVVAMLFALFAQYPDRVTLVRGNHEERHINHLYGFSQECANKCGLSRYESINEVFRHMPIAAFIVSPCLSERIFAVHGGIPSASLVALRELHPRSTYSCITDTVHNREISGWVWSDPHDTDMPFAVPNRNRNVSGAMWFPPSMSEEFCRENGVKFIVRAHQREESGYAWRHNNRLLTLFSAPNYVQSKNNGAIAVVGSADDGSFLDVHVYEYQTVVYSEPLSRWILK